jgi:hypothetical protein
VLIFCNGVGSWLKKSIRYQPIKGLPFICLQITRGPFRAPSSHEITEDGEFFVADGEGGCHLIASQESPSRDHTSRSPLQPWRRFAGRQDTLTTAATATQPFVENGNRSCETAPLRGTQEGAREPDPEPLPKVKLPATRR